MIRGDRGTLSHCFFPSHSFRPRKDRNLAASKPQVTVLSLVVPQHPHVINSPFVNKPSWNFPILSVPSVSCWDPDRYNMLVWLHPPFSKKWNCRTLKDLKCWWSNLTLAGFGGKVPPRTRSCWARRLHTQRPSQCFLISCHAGLSRRQALHCVLSWFYPHRKSTMQVLVLFTCCGWEGWHSKLAPSARRETNFQLQDGFQPFTRGFKVGSRPAMPAPSGSLRDRQMLGPWRKPTEAETPGFGPALCVSGTPPGDLKFANVWEKLQYPNSPARGSWLFPLSWVILRSFGEPRITLRMPHIDKDNTNNHICATL